VDIPGLKPLFGHQVAVSTSVGKEFVGTLASITGSTSTVMLAPLPASVANNFQFAINGVDALDIGVIAFVQTLSKQQEAGQ